VETIGHDELYLPAQSPSRLIENQTTVNMTKIREIQAIFDSFGIVIARSGG
jgi:hypothetical protein